MDATVAGLVPDAHAGTHVLALPRTRAVARTPVDALARAWFRDAAWAPPPGGGGAARPMVGARFRGVVPVEELRPGTLRLLDGARAVGPFPLTVAQTQALDLAAGGAEVFALDLDGAGPRGAPPAAPDDRDGLARAFPAGLPQGAERHVLRWAVAVARRCGGSVVTDAGVVLTPDPAASVDLTLYSAHVLAPDDLQRVLRTVLPAAVVVEVVPHEQAPPDAVVSGDTSYDGAVRLALRRVAEVPVSLTALDWRAYGPVAYELSWVPLEPHELDAERPSGLHVIARSRVRGTIARVAAMLQGRLGGTLVDDGGFVVHDLDLDERLAAASPARAR